MKKPVIRITATALCALLVLGATIFVATRPSDPIEYPNAAYTATEIGRMFPGFLYFSFGYSPNALEVCAPSTAELPAAFAAKKQRSISLPVIQMGESKALDAAEFADVVPPILTRLSHAMGLRFPEYEITSTQYSVEITYTNTTFSDLSGFSLTASQSDRTYEIYLRQRSNNNPQKLMLNDVDIQLDQTLSDSKIIASLTPIRDILFEVFGVDYPDIMIKRGYDESGEHGVSSLYVYFYDPSSPLNHYQDTPCENYIELYFNNIDNGTGDILSDSILTVANIKCEFYREGAESSMISSQHLRMLTLREAEAFLYAGQVFAARHFCAICAESAKQIDFHDYDRVSLIYRCRPISDDESVYTGIPFYVFYKEIGTAKNGHKIYAETYVPAIEFNSYEEYCKSEELLHK